MNLLLSILSTFIPNAYAAASNAAATTSTAVNHHAQKSAGSMYMPLLLVGLFLLMYLFVIRPQNKRANQQRQLLEKLAISDEVITTAGILGKITKLRDNYVTLAVNKGSEITLQKTAITTILPKGSIDNI